MIKINYEMIKLRLLKSIFLHNPTYQQPPRGEVIALGLNLRNSAEFTPKTQLANFVQSFRTQTGPEVPFSMEVEFGAVFSLSGPVSPVEQDLLVHKLFSMMVFPYTREHVAETTRRGGYPPLLLNLGLFQDNRASTAAATESLFGSKWHH